MIVAGHQPNYLPWLGFFDKIQQSDIFIIEDNVQYEHNGFVNRNRIKTQKGAMWLTVPIVHVGHQILINQVQIANKTEPTWSERHWLTMKHHYLHAPYWSKYSDFFEETYSKTWDKLIDLNIHLIKGMMNFLGINKQLVMASSLNVNEKKSRLILGQCKALDSDVQLAGAGSKDYLNIKEFEEEGIKVIFQDFKYPIYNQLYGEFVPNLSAIDYLFCTGQKSAKY
jgi:hypothetical protein